MLSHSDWAASRGAYKVRIAALSLLVIGSLLATQGHTENISTQPLTRADCYSGEMAWNDSANVCITGSTDVFRKPLTRLDCDKAGMTWNDTANVCGVAQAAEAMPEPQVAQPMPESEVADSLSQPLTRLDCYSAGMTWNDAANVCGEKSELSATQTASKETNAVASTILINIDKTKQQMTVFLDGVESYNWPVSTGKAGYSTPSGTFTATSMNEIWYSKEWDNAPMPHAIFFMKDGHAIHGSYEVKNLGKPASHGCVRISPENAATLYALVEKTGLTNTQVVLEGDPARGEGKVATQTRAKSKSSHRQASRSSRQHRNYYADTFPQRPRGGGFFRRLFGGF